VGAIPRVAVVSLLLALFACLAWLVVLAEDERVIILGWIGRR
jgi:hypothetical protein